MNYLTKSTFLFSGLLMTAALLGAEVTEAPTVEPAAAEESTAPEALPLSAAIQPRHAGAHWLYKSGLIVDGKLQSGGTAQEKVVESLTIDGVTCYKVELLIDYRSFMDRMSGVQLQPEDYSYYWEYFDAKGSHHYDGGEADPMPNPERLDQFELTMPYPVEAGHRYEADGDSYKVLATAESIKVPAGTFECVVYEILIEDNDYRARNRYYMAPGVGLVRWEEDEPNGDEWMLAYRDELVKYDLNLPEPEATPAPTE